MSYIKIETLEVSGFNSALQALHLPYDKKCDNDSDIYSEFYHTRDSESEVGSYTYGKIIMTEEIFISNHDMKLLQALIKRGDEHAKVLRGILAYAKIDAPIHFWWDLETYTVGHQRLCSGSTQNAECKGLSGQELLDVKDNIPFGRQITKIDFFSYQCLRHIYKQRLNHRNPQFREFCEWIKTLPYAEELITI